jgi:hypothetical protein
MKNSLKSIIMAAFAAIAFQGNLSAETKKSAAKPAETAEEPKAGKDVFYPLYGEVVSIDSTTLVIKGGVDKPDRNYLITQETTYVNHPKDGEAKDAKASDVKVGAWVGGRLKKAAKGNDEVVSINVGVKQKEAKEEPAKTPAKKKKTT